MRQISLVLGKIGLQQMLLNRLGVFVNLSAAFVCVDHCKLILKLQYYGTCCDGSVKNKRKYQYMSCASLKAWLDCGF